MNVNPAIPTDEKPVVPLVIDASSNGNNAVLNGPGELVSLVICGGVGTATTVIVRDTSTGYPGGGTILGTFIIPANAPPYELLLNLPITDGINVNLSQACGVKAKVVGLPETFEGSSGRIIFEGLVAAASTANTTSEASTTTAAHLNNTNRAARRIVCNGTEPARATYTLGASGMVSITPDEMFQSITFDVYLPTHGTKYNNAVPSATGSPKLDIRLETTGGVTRYQYSSLWLHQGLNRVTITRAMFGAAAFGGDTWATGTFTDLSFLISGGAGVATDIVIDNVRINSVGRKPLVVFRFDDGFRNWVTHMPYFAEKYGIPFSGFVVRDFSDNTPSTYATGAELAALREKLGKFGLFGNHTATHSGPTTMEAYSQATMETDEIVANETWLLAQGIWPSANYPKHAVMPNGQFSPEIEAAWAAQGYRTNGSVLNGGVNRDFEGINAFALPVINIAGSLSTPYTAGWQTLVEPHLLATRQDVIVLGHSMATESGGTVLGGAGASLNVTPQEYEPIFKRARQLEDAGMIKMVTMDGLADALGLA